MPAISAKYSHYVNFDFQILEFIEYAIDSGFQNPSQRNELKFPDDYRKIIVQVQTEHQEDNPMIRRHHQNRIHPIGAESKD